MERLPVSLPIWSLPTQSIGFSPEHLAFPGTLSLPAELLIQQLVAVGQQLAVAGFRRLVLFNAHGGQIALLQTAARQLHSQAPQLAVLPCFLWRGLEGLRALIDEPEASHGLHAGLAETSLMLHLAPELTGPQRQADGPDPAAIPTGWSLEGAAACAWRTAELSASGVIGNPAGASAALGEELFERLRQGWERRFDALLRSDWPARAGSG
jgi:creatinine amidohydrolase